jgi:DNA polymerase III epsilon subunit-like protein
MQPDMKPLAFLDTEATGLDPAQHEIWEVALILRRVDRLDDGFTEYLPDVEHVWQLPVDLGRADPIGLNIGRFHERRWPVFAPGFNDQDLQMLDSRQVAGAVDGIEGGGDYVVANVLMRAWAEHFVELTRDAQLIGNVVSFDEERLRQLLRRLGQCPMWHYHLVDVECLAAGYLAGRHRGLSPEGPTDDRALLARPPWNSEDLSQAVGVDPRKYDQHTALGDARWAKAIYDAVVTAP